MRMTNTRKEKSLSKRVMTKKGVTAKRGFLQPYKSYLFRTKDPIIDKIHTVIDDSGMSYREINERSGVSTSAMNGWINGATRRPQFCTIAAVAGACGKQLVMVNKK